MGKIIFCCSLRSRYFHLAEKYQAFSLNSQQQKVQRFYLLTGTIHHVIVIGDLLVYIYPFGADIPHIEKPSGWFPPAETENPSWKVKF